MSISGKQNINIGLPNESIDSDSLYTAFTKTDQNFNTLFSCASPFTNFVGSTGIGVTSNANTGTVTITNTGVTNIIAGTNIAINRSNGNVTISATGGGNGGGGITSVGLVPGNVSRLVVTNSPLVAAGNLGIDLATTGITEGTYTNPNLTVDPYGRVVGITNGPAVGTVTSVGLTAGPGVQVNGGPIQSSGNIIVTNTGVIRLTAGSGIDLSGSNGNVTVSIAGGGVGSVTSVGIYSTSLTVSGSPITTNGNIRVELPANPATAGTFTAGNLTTSGTLVVTGNANVGNIGGTSGVFTSNVAAGNVSVTGEVVATTLGGTLTTAAQPNITSVGTLTSLGVAGTITAGNANLGNAVVANFFIGSGANLFAIQAANVVGVVANAANSLRVTTTAQTSGIYYPSFVSATPTANYGLNSNSAFVANIANGQFAAPLLGGILTSVNQPNIVSVGTLTALNVSGNANIGNLGLSGVLSVVGNANVGNIGATNGVFTNVSGNGSALSAITGGNVTGQVGNALVAGTVYTAAQPNITSVGTLSNLAVSGNVSFTGANVSLGQIANLKILGGTANAILRTDGTGNLSWTTPTTSYVHTQSSAATTWIVTHNLGVQYVNVQLIDNTGNSFTGRYNYPTITFNNTSALTVTFDSAQAGYAAVTSGGGAQGPQGNPGTAGGGAISNGVSNVTIVTSGGNVTTSVGGTANVLTVTQTGANISGTLNATGNANVGNIGATNGVFTNVSGNGSALTAIAGANVTGTVANATYATSAGSATTATTATTATSATTAGTVTTAAQPNITSVGTLTGLTVSSTITGSVSGSAGTAGTVTTAAQPNITSVGTLTSLTVTGNANLSGNINFTGAKANLGSNANLTITGGTGGQLLSTDGAGNLSWVSQGSVIGGAAGANTQVQFNALNLLSASANFTFNYLTNVLTVGGNIVSNSTVGGSSATLLGTTLTTGANTTAGTLTGNWSLSAGSRLQSTYADLAEYYEADDVYAWGNVVEFGGEKEITIASNETTKVAGVVSKNPAYVMNATCPGLLTAVALQGRVPCNVIGPVSKGDMMVSAGAGYAKACSSPSLGSVIGKSLENFSGTEGLIEIVVGRL